VTPIPLTGTRNANQLQLSWPSANTGWQLQSQTNPIATGLGTNWFNLPGSTMTNQITVPIGLSDEAVFFRLIYP
jgi:hypothetical protein